MQKRHCEFVSYDVNTIISIQEEYISRRAIVLMARIRLSNEPLVTVDVIRKIIAYTTRKKVVLLTFFAV